ncbi:nucleotidyl transferase AbiEii/AbiGii toxin family protein [Thalassoglobus sp. JC818]|uniref:nucleotidyl transferase AbiEii/AbiGii toxin family protein n=1 Tax=Thalassoglobus sp. JC818 TaxID=3232136 RepID=UPI003459E7D1
MSRPPARNLAASVRQKLLNLSRERRENFNQILTRYALERFLYRMSQSEHRDLFVLKGAMLFQIWTADVHRPTRDLDLLGAGTPDPEHFREIFSTICSVDVSNDGMVYLPESVIADQIKEDADYQGIRVRLTSQLVTARIPIQIDIGFGDAITPEPISVTYPTILDLEPPQLMAYPRETVIAEKLHALVVLGIANSRMKDFYDLWTLANQDAFIGLQLSDAIRATFVRRKTALPSETPFALTDEFAADPQKSTQWTAFHRKSRLSIGEATFSEVLAQLRSFLIPPLEALQREIPFEMKWPPRGPWTTSKN